MVKVLVFDVLGMWFVNMGYLMWWVMVFMVFLVLIIGVLVGM